MGRQLHQSLSITLRLQKFCVCLLLVSYTFLWDTTFCVLVAGVVSQMKIKISEAQNPTQLWVCTSPQLSWITQHSLVPFEGCQGSCGIVPNGPASLVVSFNICQGLKCKHVASTPTLTMRLLQSNYTLHWTTKFLGVFSKTDTNQCQQRYILDPRSSAEFSNKMCKCFRSLAEDLVALAFLCCHYIFDSYIICLTLNFNTVMSTSIHISFSVFKVLNSNYCCHIQIYFKKI